MSEVGLILFFSQDHVSNGSAKRAEIVFLSDENVWKTIILDVYFRITIMNRHFGFALRYVVRFSSTLRVVVFENCCKKLWKLTYEINMKSFQILIDKLLWTPRTVDFTLLV